MIERYFTLAYMNQQLQEKYLARGMVLELHHKEFIERPRKTLSKICKYLKLRCNKKYLDDCAKIIFKTPTLTRQYVVWTEKQKEEVLKRMKDYSFLRKYTFQS